MACVPDACHGVLHKLGGDEANAAPYILVMFVYLSCQRVYGAVHGLTALALAPVRPSFFGFQISGFTDTFVPICSHSASMLTLHRSWQCSVLADFCPVDIEEDGECATPFGVYCCLLSFHDYVGFGLLNGDSEA